jgi:hypothetical protein
MHINIYSDELLGHTQEVVEKVKDGTPYYGLRITFAPNACVTFWARSTHDLHAFVESLKVTAPVE